MSSIRWQKSSYSSEGNACVEIAVAAEVILIRESDDPETVVSTTPEKLSAFIRGIKAGEFDDLLT